MAKTSLSPWVSPFAQHDHATIPICSKGTFPGNGEHLNFGSLQRGHCLSLFICWIMCISIYILCLPEKEAQLSSASSRYEQQSVSTTTARGGRKTSQENIVLYVEELIASLKLVCICTGHQSSVTFIPGHIHNRLGTRNWVYNWCWTSHLEKSLDRLFKPLAIIQLLQHFA